MKNNKIIRTKDLSLFNIPNDSNYQKIVARKTVPLLRLVFPLGICDKDKYEKVLGYKHSYSPFYFGRDIYYNFDTIDKEKRILVNLYKKDKNSLLRLANECETKGNILLKKSLNIKKKYVKELCDKDLQKLFEEYYGLLINFDTYLIMPLAIQKYLENSIDEELEKHNLSAEEFENYRGLLCTPLKKNMGTKEQENILKIAIKFQQIGLTHELKEKIKEHIFEYGHLGSKYGIGEIWNQKDVTKRIEFLSKNNLSHKLKGILFYENSNKNKINEILNKFKASEEFKNLVKIARTYVYLRTFRTDIISASIANIFNLLTEIGKRNSLSKKDMLNCFGHEIIDNEIPPKEILNEREELVMRGLDSKVYYAQGNDAKEIVDQVMFSLSYNEDEIVDNFVKGRMASSGKAKGRVRILLSNEDLSKVEKGDIIVASMTTPDFVPAMERAAAFVTDEGGILCHAAIVSREMGRPCVTGTQKATKIFSDGDLVEVDANNGVVRKLE